MVAVSRAEEGPYSFSGILKQALNASLGVADAGCGIDAVFKGRVGGDDLVRMAMSMDLETPRVNETIERFRSEGVSPHFYKAELFRAQRTRNHQIVGSPLCRVKPQRGYNVWGAAGSRLSAFAEAGAC